MQLSKTDNLYDPDFYYKHKYFILPFTCGKCDHKFMFEPGILEYRFPRDKPKSYYNYAYPVKYCRICSRESEEDILKTLESWTKPKTDDWSLHKTSDAPPYSCGVMFKDGRRTSY